MQFGAATTDSPISFQIGAEWMSEDCSLMLYCVVCESCNRPVGEIHNNATRCYDGFVCVNADGVSQCLGMWRERCMLFLSTFNILTMRLSAMCNSVIGWQKRTKESEGKTKENVIRVTFLTLYIVIDGVHCSLTDKDECAENTDNCNTNAACTNTQGSFECICNEGFSGNGVSCEGMYRRSYVVTYISWVYYIPRKH